MLIASAAPRKKITTKVSPRGLVCLGANASLGIHAGQTTPDGRITLGHEECLGSCGTAPIMRVDGSYHENLDAEAARRIIDALE